MLRELLEQREALEESWLNTADVMRDKIGTEVEKIIPELLKKTDNWFVEFNGMSYFSFKNIVSDTLTLGGEPIFKFFGLDDAGESRYFKIGSGDYTQTIFICTLGKQLDIRLTVSSENFPTWISDIKVGDVESLNGALDSVDKCIGKLEYAAELIKQM